MTLEDLDLGQVVVAAPVVGAVSDNNAIGSEDAVGRGDDVL